MVVVAARHRGYQGKRFLEWPVAWSTHPDAGRRLLKRLAPRDGFEPPAKRLKVACSTAVFLGRPSDIRKEIFRLYHLLNTSLRDRRWLLLSKEQSNVMLKSNYNSRMAFDFLHFFTVRSIYFSMKNTVSPSMRLNLCDFLISWRSSGLKFWTFAAASSSEKVIISMPLFSPIFTNRPESAPCVSAHGTKLV